MILQGQVGAPQASIATGTNPPVRQGQLGDVIVSELHGRFYEQAYRGAFFRSGTTAVVAGTANHGTANGASATLATAAAATPMLGLWNPVSSGVNVVLTQAQLAAYANTVTTPAPFGALVWHISLGNSAITTGLLPFNSKTLTQTGSMVKAFAGATALTGLTNIMTPLEVSDFVTGGQSIAYGTLANTAVSTPTVGIQNFDGQLIIPPGAVLALYNTAATTTYSFSGRLLWEEVAV